MTQRADQPLQDRTIEKIEELFESTGRVARRHFRGDLEALAAADKGGAAGYDPVTAADEEIEALLRAGISRFSPGDRVIGEEGGASGPQDARRTWFLDPIDGTKAFLTGMTGWGTLVGVVEDGRAVAGWMDQPVLGETFAAVDGRAVVRRPAAGGGSVEVTDLRASGCTELSEAVLYTTHPSTFGEAGGEARRRDDELGLRVRLQRFGGDCYAYCMLAAGRVDLVVESELNAYDIVALIPIVEAAGGVVVGSDGGQPLEGGTVVAAATRELAEQAWAVLRPEG